MNTRDYLVVAVVAILVVLACSYIVSNGSGEDEKSTDRIGIIGAMEPEVALLIDSMDLEYTKTIADMKYHVGKIGDQDVVVVQCGMGKVNAGICAQTLISEFKVGSVINTGVGGALDERLTWNDFVISTDALQHDFDVEPIGFKKGEIPFTGKISFEADEKLIEEAVTAVKKAAPLVNVYEGRICSGDQFISSTEQKDEIVSNFGGMCCEMEGGAIAQVCYLNHVPFVIIRTISDKADGTGPDDYDQFMEQAAKRSAMVVHYMVSH